jgi:hypothetical protein
VAWNRSSLITVLKVKDKLLWGGGSFIIRVPDTWRHFGCKVEKLYAPHASCIKLVPYVPNVRFHSSAAALLLRSWVLTFIVRFGRNTVQESYIWSQVQFCAHRRREAAVFFWAYMKMYLRRGKLRRWLSESPEHLCILSQGVTFAIWLFEPFVGFKYLWLFARTALFWVVTQRVVIIPYRRFETSFRSHPQDSWIPEPWGWSR